MLKNRKESTVYIVLDELYSQIHALVSIKHLKTEFDEKNLPEIINLDSTLMQRAIMNIVTNAVDYSPDGGLIQFFVSAEKHRFRFTVSKY